MTSSPATPKVSTFPPLSSISRTGFSSVTVITSDSDHSFSSKNWACFSAVEVNDLSSSSSAASTSSPEANVGRRIKVTVPLKVYHVPKVDEVDITGLEGEIKQYVGLWKGKRISANLPYKVEFFAEIPGRDGPVKFVAHLKDDEFEFV